MSEVPTSDLTPKQITFGPCCFCGESIEQTDVDPCGVEVVTREEKWQTWFCHASCFRERLIKGKWMEPAHF